MQLRVAFFGTPIFSVPILESIYQKHHLVAVISQPDKPAGKGREVSPSPVSQFAQGHHIPLYTPTSLKDEQFKQQFEILDIDIAVVVAYGKILPQWILDVPQHGAINIHASLLPQHRGASPVNASILQGDTETGISYIIMNRKMDEGDVIYQSKTSIFREDTAVSLAIKLSQSASKDINLLLEKYVTGQLQATAQDHSQATYCGILTKDDGRIDFDQPPSDLERRVRAYYPWPGVWGTYKGKRVKLLPNQQVQMEGKKATALENFKHGYPDFPLASY